MCGRYTVAVEAEKLAAHFKADFSLPWKPSYNAAPSQMLPIITNLNPGKIVLAKWGFEKESLGHTFRPQINARIEGIEHKPLFKESFKARRCIVLADGFYEWKTRGRIKQPYRFTLQDGSLFAFAGIYSRSEMGDGPLTFAILTGGPNELVQNVHNRMPVILPRGHEKEWLPPLTGAQFPEPPYPAEAMRMYPVSKKVGSPSFNAPEALLPAQI